MELQAERSGARETIRREPAGIRGVHPDLLDQETPHGRSGRASPWVRPGPLDYETIRAEWDRERLTFGAVPAVAGSYLPRNSGGRRSEKARWPSR